MHTAMGIGRLLTGAGRVEMSERADDVRATADQLMADAEALQAIEAAKVALPDDDPRVVALSEEAARLTESMSRTAKVQLAVAAEDTAS